MLRPEVPERLRVAARTGNLVPFIGTGVSRLGGTPGWEEFASAALRSFLGPGMLDYAQLEQLDRLTARAKLSIAVGLEQRYRQPIGFRAILQPSEKRPAGISAYRHLARLARTFVTTNYDEWLDSVAAPAPSVSGTSPEQGPLAARNVLHDPATFNLAALSVPDTVIHIHGSVFSRDNMIVTTSDYLQRYASHRISGSGIEENPYLTFLELLFRTRNVLFIGYGLTELEILEYVFVKARSIRRGSEGERQEEPRHYLLQGFYSYETALMQNLKDYYLNECGIGLIPFLKDQKGWEQLVDVMEYLAGEIPVGEILASQRRLEMEELLE